MKMTETTKLKCLELTYDIKKLCERIEATVLKSEGRFCFQSGKFSEIDHLHEKAKKLKELNCDVNLKIHN